MSRVSQHVRSNVVGYVAVFLAMSGSAAALQGKNSVDSGDIKKNAVRSSDIKTPNGVKSKDVLDDGLAGIDINEATLGQVPSAANADNATNAQNATNATNADMLGGVAPGGFVMGGGSLLRARAGLNDGETDVSLLSIPGVGSFTVSCTNSADTVGTRFVNQSGGRVVRIHAERIDTTTDLTGGSLNDGQSTTRTTTQTGPNQGHLHTYEIAPADGPGPIAHVRIATVSSATGDERCVFWASAIAG